MLFFFFFFFFAAPWGLRGNAVGGFCWIVSIPWCSSLLQMRDNYYRTGEGFMCVYAITMMDSFDKLENFFEQILRVTDRENVPFVLVGNKCDLEEQRQVQKQQGTDLAEKYSCAFMETSAKNNTNVEEAFYTLIRATIQTKDSVTGKKSSGGGCMLL